MSVTRFAYFTSWMCHFLGGSPTTGTRLFNFYSIHSRFFRHYTLSLHDRKCKETSRGIQTAQDTATFDLPDTMSGLLTWKSLLRYSQTAQIYSKYWDLSECSLRVCVHGFEEDYWRSFHTQRTEGWICSPLGSPIPDHRPGISGLLSHDESAALTLPSSLLQWAKVCLLVRKSVPRCCHSGSLSLMCSCTSPHFISALQTVLQTRLSHRVSKKLFILLQLL